MLSAKYIFWGIFTCLVPIGLNGDINSVYEEASAVERSQKGFEEAEGFGAYSQGGNGGGIIKVTTLEDSEKPGSLRWAINQDYPRIVEFDVSGTIVLKSNLYIRKPFITIDGSTAPGKGVTLKDGSLIVNETHDVILRYLKVRPGDEAILHKGIWEDSDRKAGSMDAISVDESAFVIVDHCSTSWGSDEVLSATTCRNVTVSNCIIAEPLANPKVHIEDGEAQSHPFGALCSGDGVSYIKNLFAYFRIRAPQMGYESDNALDGTERKREVINNFIYAYSGSATRISFADPITLIHLINNQYERTLSKEAVAIYLRYADEYSHDSLKLPKLYLAGNKGPNFSGNQWDRVKNDLSEKHTLRIKSKEPLFNSDVKVWDTDKVKHRVLNRVGATLPVRDAIDSRVIDQIMNGKGNIIQSQDDVGGYNY